MKLYDVPRNTFIRVKDHDYNDIVLLFSHIDGMFSYCVNEAGDVLHLAAWSDVEIVGDDE